MTDIFTEQSPRLFAIAYRMLGSAVDAEDVVQDAYLRWQSTDRSEVASPEAFLRKIVVRLCLDSLKSARSRRESYPGLWLPEPILTEIPSEFADPGDRVGKTESISMAFLLLLESLSPDERAVFLLHEVFDYDYDDLAMLLERSNAACRQMFSRAKKHIIDHRPRFQASAEQHHQLLARFVQAVQQGDVAQLTALLAADAISYSDGGGKAAAATRPVMGRAAVIQLVLGLMRRTPAEATVAVDVVNGREALVFREHGQVQTAMAFAATESMIQTLFFVRNPDKLNHV